MGFKKFSEWLAEQEVPQLNALQQRKVNTAVSKSLSSMAPDQAMGAVQGNDPQAQKKLIARSLAKPHVGGIDDIAPVVGIKTKSAITPSMMRKK